MPIEYCEAAAGGTCSDLKASYSGQDGVPLAALLLYAWKWMDGQCLTLLSNATQWKEKSVPHLTIQSRLPES